jgi:hypothetical protein
MMPQDGDIQTRAVSSVNKKLRFLFAYAVLARLQSRPYVRHQVVG